MKTITRFRTFLFLITLATLSSCLPDSFTKFEEDPVNQVDVPTNDGGTTPTIPGANTSSCTGTAAECYGPAAVRYEDQTYDLDNPTTQSNFGPLIIGNDVPVEQLTFSLVTQNPPAGLGFNPNTGEFFGTPLEYYNDLIEVRVVHPNTGKQFDVSFRLVASRQITEIRFIYPKHNPGTDENYIILSVADAEQAIAQFDATQTLVTEKGTKLKIEYIDPVTFEIFTYVDKAGPISIGDKIDNNAFYVSEKAIIENAVYAIDKNTSVGAGARKSLLLETVPSLENLTKEQKSQVLQFTTDPTDKELDTDLTGLSDEFYICDLVSGSECDGDNFGSFKIHSGATQQEKSVQVKIETLDGTELSSVITYRVLNYARPKSITKVVYPQNKEQRLKIDLADEDLAAKFTAGGFITNERGAKAEVSFVSGTEIFVKIAEDSEYYFAPGDKIDNEENFFFEEGEIPSSETDTAITYVFPVDSFSNEVPSLNAQNYINNFYLEPDFYFPDGKKKLFDNSTLEESQTRVSISPNPSTKESNITYGNNLAGSYTFDFCDANSNGKYDEGTDQKNIPASSCTFTFYPSGSMILGDLENTDAGLFSFPFCNTNNSTARVYETTDSININRASCGESNWIGAGSLMLGGQAGQQITNKLESQIFQISVKNALGNEYQFLFKMSFDNPPQRLSLNKYLLVPVTNTQSFDIGDYISTSAPTDSNIDCRSFDLALSLSNFGGTFNAITSADALAQNEDFWNCGVGIVTDIFDTSRIIAADKANENDTDLATSRKYHAGASLQRYIGVKVIKGRFQKGMSLDNVKIFSSEKSIVNLDPIPYNMIFVVRADDASDAAKKNELVDRISTANDIFDKSVIIKPADSSNDSSGVLVAMFPITTDPTDNRFKFLVQATPDQSSCALDINAASGGNCRFVSDQTLTSTNELQLIDPDTGQVLEENIQLNFIQAESAYIKIAGGIGKGDELTTNPNDSDLERTKTVNKNYYDYVAKPLNAVVMEESATAPNEFEIFIREGMLGVDNATTTSPSARASNPFSGSKYYYNSASSRPNSMKDAIRNGTSSNDLANLDSPFGNDDPAQAQKLEVVKSSNIFYLYKDDPVLIKAFVHESTDTIYQVNPALPGGLFLDPDKGEIRGAPKGKSDPQVYTLTAINPFGSTKSYFTIQVMEYFGIELFATDSEPFSYILHKEGQGNEVTQCRVLKNQIERAQNVSTFSQAQKIKKIVDIGCWLEAGEKDLWQKGINIAMRIPNNTCEYVVHEPYQFYAFKPGKTTGAGFESSKMIYEHVTVDLGPLADQAIANAWNSSVISNPNGINKAIHIIDGSFGEEQIIEHFKAGNQCNSAQVNGWNSDINGDDRTATRYPSIGGKDAGGGNNFVDFPNSSSDITKFEYPNGEPVMDSFGSVSMLNSGDARKFLCSYNYEIGDIAGPKCDSGKVSIRKVNWKLGGARCFAKGFGFFDVENPAVLATKINNGLTPGSEGPCKKFTFEGTGLSCKTSKTSGTDEEIAAADETCSQSEDSVACLNNTANECVITDGGDYSKEGIGSISDDSFCHIPLFATVEFSLKEEDNTVTPCGGEQNNCISGPAVQEPEFSGSSDGRLFRKSFNVVKENGFDSLGGETFNYLPSEGALLGNGENVNASIGRQVRSNIYLANYIGNPAEDTVASTSPNFAPFCAFTPPNSNAFNQATQYDIDAMIRGIGYHQYNAKPTDSSSDLQDDVDAGYYGVSDPSLIKEPLYGSRPYYGYSCLDSADNIVARIRLIVRDWNKTFKPSDHISLVSPDLGHCNDGDPSSSDDIDFTSGDPTIVKCKPNDQSVSPEAEESLMDNQFKTIFDDTTFNDYFDWDDYGFSKSGNSTSCFNLNMRNPSTSSNPCYGQCNRYADGSCYVGGTNNTNNTQVECWERTGDQCLEATDGTATGCILKNFPAFDY